jgi:hypothetical protein
MSLSDITNSLPDGSRRPEPLVVLDPQAFALDQGVLWCGASNVPGELAATVLLVYRAKRKMR